MTKLLHVQAALFQLRFKSNPSEFHDLLWNFMVPLWKLAIVM